MSEQHSSREHLWRSLVDRVDSCVVPIGFGCLSMLVIVQMVTAIPAVRTAVDSVSGRFVSQPHDIIPASVTSEQGDITLYVSPSDTRPDINVYINDEKIGDLSRTSLDVHVKDGDKISLQLSGTAGAFIQVNHDDPNLLVPAPGQTYELAPNDGMVELPAVRFVH